MGIEEFTAKLTERADEVIRIDHPGCLGAMDAYAHAHWYTQRQRALRAAAAPSDGTDGLALDPDER